MGELGKMKIYATTGEITYSDTIYITSSILWDDATDITISPDSNFVYVTMYEDSIQWFSRDT